MDTHEADWQRANLKFKDSDRGMTTTLMRLRGGWVDVVIEDEDGEDPILRSFPTDRVEFVNWVVPQDEDQDERDRQASRLQEWLADWGPSWLVTLRDPRHPKGRSMKDIAAGLSEVRGLTSLTLYDCLDDEEGNVFFDVQVIIEAG